MEKKYKILQIGPENWRDTLALPAQLDWYHVLPNKPSAIQKIMDENDLDHFHAVILTDGAYLVDLLPFTSSLEPYTVFYPEQFVSQEQNIQNLIKQHCMQAKDLTDRQGFVRDLSTSLFEGGYGDKLSPATIRIHPSFQGSVSYQGFEHLELEGDFGKNYTQLASWAYNQTVQAHSPIELWLEYEKSGPVDLCLRLRKIPAGSISEIRQDILLKEADFAQAIIVEQDYDAYLSISLEARGQGKVNIGNLHQRWSRKQFGKFVLGGSILHDKKREEINYFFHPGDFKPPLAVYFSGYRPAEGFEGYWMMKNLQCPFLLFSDPRLEGGAFYLGTEELEDKIQATIQYYLDYLGLDRSDLILSGLSMGTFPALYYGSHFEPKGIVVGKPLTNLGTIAKRGRLEAPGVFPTSFDVLHLQTGGVSLKDMKELDQRFWTRFKKADFSQTTFGLSYMKDEDMDSGAYDQLVETLCQTGAKILSKGTAGRHNDDTGTNVAWFIHFYKMILEEYGRGDT